MGTRLTLGIGINDADYPVTKQAHPYNEDGKRLTVKLWECPFFAKWRKMMERCYSTSYHTRHPTYIECNVCPEWLRFTNFKTWMEQQEWRDKELDKDILWKGNKTYSPENCIFVSAKVNTFFNIPNSGSGKYPTGVVWNNARSKYEAKCSNPFTGKLKSLGRFNNPYEAHEAWHNYKLELAEKLITSEGLTGCLALAIIERVKEMKMFERH